jgi:hypothetical protein
MIKDFKAEVRRKEFKKRYENQLDKTTVWFLIALAIAFGLLIASFLNLFIVTFY